MALKVVKCERWLVFFGHFAISAVDCDVFRTRAEAIIRESSLDPSKSFHIITLRVFDQIVLPPEVSGQIDEVRA